MSKENPQFGELIERYSLNEISVDEFVAGLQALEKIHRWRYALDEDVVQVRDITNDDFLLVVEMDRLIGDTTAQIIDESKDEVEPLPEISIHKKTVALLGAARNFKVPHIAADIVTEFLKFFPKEEYAVIVGGYIKGTPLVGAITAWHLGYDVIAFVPACGDTDAFKEFEKRGVYAEVVRHPKWKWWSNETPALAKNVSPAEIGGAALFIGGGPWTMREYRELRRQGKKMYLVDGFKDMVGAIASVAPTAFILHTASGDFRVTEDA